MTSRETLPGRFRHETNAGRFFSGGARTPRATNRGSCAEWSSRRHGLVAVGEQQLFALPYAPEVGAELPARVKAGMTEIAQWLDTMVADRGGRKFWLDGF